MKLLCIDDKDYEKLLDFFSDCGHDHSNCDELYDYAVDVDEKNCDLTTELIRKQLEIDDLKRTIVRLKQTIENKTLNIMLKVENEKIM
jgi:hypothetical protein